MIYFLVYVKYSLESLLICLSTCDYIGKGDITEIAIFPLGDWGENIIQEK